MPRANRHFLPSHIWHITHRCHQKEFLLKFARDRRRYLHWLFEAKKRFGLSVLNYMITHGASRGSCNPAFSLVEQRSPCLLAMIAFLRSIYSTDKTVTTSFGSSQYSQAVFLVRTSISSSSPQFIVPADETSGLVGTASFGVKLAPL